MTVESFGAQLLALPKIFENRSFIIPDYQRGYSWEKKHVKDLLKDIDHLMNDGIELQHYTGTLVLSRPDGNAPGEFHVVDGQQRLTTLVILMRMLSEHLPEKDQVAFATTYLRRGASGNDKLVLRLNSDTHPFFEEVVMGDGNTTNNPPTLEAHERLFESRTLICEWLDRHLKSKKVEVGYIRKIIETELGFLVYAPKEDAETGIMFEVINNRGKPLSELEKVKNYLIYCCVKLSAKETRDSIDRDWSVRLRDLNTAKKTSPSDEGAFLRYCVVVYFELNKWSSQYGYDELKKKIDIDVAMENQDIKSSTIKKIEDFVKFLKGAALWYTRLYGKQYNGIDDKPDLIEILKLLRAQEQHASIMPIFLALVCKPKVNIDRLVSLLKLLEILNFRVYMAYNMTSRNDTGQAGLYKDASSYFHDELQEDELQYRLVEFVSSLANDKRFKKSFELDEDSPNDFFYWGGLRYFLMNYEMEQQPKKTIHIEDILLSRKDAKSGDYLSVEHLWALENRNKESENNRKEDKFEKRRLGNFVLLELGLNSTAKAIDLKDKLSIYEEGIREKKTIGTDLVQVKEMARDVEKLLSQYEPVTTPNKDDFLKFHKDLNTLREKRYIEFAEKRWSLISWKIDPTVAKEVFSA